MGFEPALSAVEWLESKYSKLSPPPCEFEFFLELINDKIHVMSGLCDVKTAYDLVLHDLYGSIALKNSKRTTYRFCEKLFSINDDTVEIPDTVRPEHIVISGSSVRWLEPVNPESYQKAITMTEGDFSWQEGSE